MDSLTVVEELTTEQKAELFQAIIDYQNGKEVVLSGLMKAIFIPFKNQFERDNDKYSAIVERNKLNGAKGGRRKNPKKPKEPQRNPVGYLETQLNPTKADNDNDNDNDNDSKNDSDSKNEKENSFLTAILDSDYITVLDLWLQHKKERNEKYKPTGLKTLAEKIKEDYKTVQDFENAVKYSISNNWAGIYPPKPQNNQPTNIAAPNKMVY
jgi:hypothetical protein